VWPMLARSLGWFGIALGVLEVIAPRRAAALVGTRRGAAARTLPVLGAREIASGVGILASGRPTGWLWSRVLGDMLDLAVLGRSLRGPRRSMRRPRLLGSIGAVVAVTVLDLLCAWVFTRRRQRARLIDRSA
jgi:hypothetical protein